MFLLIVNACEGSVSSDASNFQVLENRKRSGSVNVVMMGWWSEMNIGSVVASESRGRAFCVRKM